MSTMPEGFHSITPYITVSNAAAAIKLYENALNATDEMRMIIPGTDKIMHACLTIGSSKLFICDENPEQGMLAPKDSSMD